ncbi:unnamed protein product [Protopolystoma xenopodis]|uniref:Uncharacterized protein n=1 Tax=Protopolystoma xenopodis TaxID=117903 RepID=A0A448X0W5_9PLAT|nr:unnamed protein product [Protopolystoma xenopodis]
MQASFSDLERLWLLLTIYRLGRNSTPTNASKLALASLSRNATIPCEPSHNTLLTSSSVASSPRPTLLRLTGDSSLNFGLYQASRRGHGSSGTAKHRLPQELTRSSSSSPTAAHRPSARLSAHPFRATPRRVMSMQPDKCNVSRPNPPAHTHTQPRPHQKGEARRPNCLEVRIHTHHVPCHVN